MNIMPAQLMAGPQPSTANLQSALKQVDALFQQQLMRLLATGSTLMASSPHIAATRTMTVRTPVFLPELYAGAASAPAMTGPAKAKGKDKRRKKRAASDTPLPSRGTH